MCQDNCEGNCKNMKHCPDCDTNKPVLEFYKAGGYYQKRCKICHNKFRRNYKASHKKKMTGFGKLPAETQKDILEDIKKMTKKAVAEKYNIPYQNITRWTRQGQIPKVKICRKCSKPTPERQPDDVPQGLAK